MRELTESSLGLAIFWNLFAACEDGITLNTVNMINPSKTMKLDGALFIFLCKLFSA